MTLQIGYKKTNQKSFKTMFKSHSILQVDIVFDTGKTLFSLKPQGKKA